LIIVYSNLYYQLLVLAKYATGGEISRKLYPSGVRSERILKDKSIK